jgi:hypothetical protein
MMELLNFLMVKRTKVFLACFVTHVVLLDLAKI